jgi:hypothetical protein
MGDASTRKDEGEPVNSRQSSPTQEALDAAIQEGVKQFEQQMKLGGGNLNNMFEAVVRVYLETAQPEVMDETKLYDLAQQLIVECIQPTTPQSITTRVMDILRPYLRTNSGEE